MRVFSSQLVNSARSVDHRLVGPVLQRIYADRRISRFLSRIQISGPQKAIYSDVFSLFVLDLYPASELEVLVSEEHSFLGGVCPEELLSFLP